MHGNRWVSYSDMRIILSPYTPRFKGEKRPIHLKGRGTTVYRLVETKEPLNLGSAGTLIMHPDTFKALEAFLLRVLDNDFERYAKQTLIRGHK